MREVIEAASLYPSIKRLGSQDQSRTALAILDFRYDESAEERLRYHKLQSNDFWSFSATKGAGGVRVLVLPTPNGGRVLVHADYHDDAYKWADRRRGEVDASGVVRVVEVVESSQAADGEAVDVGLAVKREIRRRIADWRSRTEESGKYVGPAPYGYQKTSSGDLDENHYEQAMIRRIREMRSLGMTTQQIADTLNSENARTRTGKEWRRGTVFAVSMSGCRTGEEHHRSRKHDRDRIRQLSSEGLSVSEIAESLNICRSSVSAILSSRTVFLLKKVCADCESSIPARSTRCAECQVLHKKKCAIAYQQRRRQRIKAARDQQHETEPDP